MSVTARTAERVREVVGKWPERPNADTLNVLLRMLGRWRSHMLAATYVAHHGTRIYGGPFAGMDYVLQTAEGSLIPRLLGTYESELHPHFTALLADGVDCVIDVGCAEGYYAVGLARMAPELTVYAYDIDEGAQRLCGELAAKNGVADRVIVGGEFAPDGFEAFKDRRPLVLVDVEGAELQVLQPELSPSLAGMNIIVETHGPRELQIMIERFSPTHDIIRVDQQPKTFDMPGWLQELTHLDQLLAVWEWRGIITPWLVMRPKAG